MTTIKEKLTGKSCQACEGNETPFNKAQILEYLKDLSDWSVVQNDKILVREFKARNFMAAVDLINRIAGIAEEEEHHPDIHLTNFRQLKVEFTTHAIDGLSENDFIMAAKVDELPFEEKT